MHNTCAYRTWRGRGRCRRAVPSSRRAVDRRRRSRRVADDDEGAQKTPQRHSRTTSGSSRALTPDLSERRRGGELEVVAATLRDRSDH